LFCKYTDEPEEPGTYLVIVSENPDCRVYREIGRKKILSRKLRLLVLQ